MKQLDPIIAREGQTVFTISGGYAPDALLVTVNGVIISREISVIRLTLGATDIGKSALESLPGKAIGAIRCHEFGLHLFDCGLVRQFTPIRQAVEHL